MSDIRDTDKFLVNRNNSSYHIEAQNLMAEVRDTDLLLVNRDGKSYKATGLEIKDSLGGPSASINKPVIVAPTDLSTPEVDDLIFIGSIPTGFEINTWGKATWEVDTDVRFNSAMVAEKAITPGAQQTLSVGERGSIVLEADTLYYVRLKYDSTDPALAEYSDVVMFTPEEEDIPSNITTPGDLYYFEPNPFRQEFIDIPDGEKVVIATGGETQALCVTTSGKAYLITANHPTNPPTADLKGIIPAESIKHTVCVGQGSSIFYPSIDNKTLYDLTSGASYVTESASPAELLSYSFSQNGANVMLFDMSGNAFSVPRVYTNGLKGGAPCNNTVPYKNIMHGTYSATGTGFGLNDKEIYDLTYSGTSSNAAFTISSETKNAEYAGTQWKQVVVMDRGMSLGSEYILVGLTESDELKVIKPHAGQLEKGLETDPSVPSNIRKIVSSATQVALTTTDGRLFLAGADVGSGGLFDSRMFVNGVTPTATSFGELIIPRSADRLTVSQYLGIGIILP